jgi:protein gp37
MATKSRIEWTENTWNPVTGCSRISAGCKNCYAARMAKRLHAMGVERYRNGFKVTLHHDLIELPKTWRQPRVIFVNSMSDLFHNDVPDAFIKAVFNTMRQCPQHTFQVLTKRAKRLYNLSGDLCWSHNIWMGVSVEDASQYERIRLLAESDAKVKFLSCEPLIGRLEKLPLRNIDWVIVGGESGPFARPMQPGWVTEIRDRCQQQGVPYFFKQWGGTNKKATGRVLDGRTWDDMPPLAHQATT